jgi:hypothetical protein
MLGGRPEAAGRDYAIGLTPLPDVTDLAVVARDYKPMSIPIFSVGTLVPD